MKRPAFKNIKILLADNDIQIAGIVAQNLGTLGFTNIHHVRNSTETINYLKENSVDILITEWVLSPVDGIDLVRFIRRDKDSPNPQIPIIMLTGKSETKDVMLARDVGITEFLVKPFTFETLFRRVEYLIDFARGFVLSSDYVGPDRRRKVVMAEDKDRRIRKPKTIKEASEITTTDLSPVLISPQYDLKKKIGLDMPFSAMLTPEILADAQKVIDNMRDESVQWVKEDLGNLEKALAELQDSPFASLAVEKMIQEALSIKSRTGTFGFHLASEVARILYLFLSNKYDRSKKLHTQVLIQSVSALKVVFANDIQKDEKMGLKLLQELQQLMQKIAA